MTSKLGCFADSFLPALVVASAALHWSSAQVPWELPHSLGSWEEGGMFNKGNVQIRR